MNASQPGARSARRLIGVVTSARSDFGLLLPLIEDITAAAHLSGMVYATGMHHASRYGHTIDEVRAALAPEMLREVVSFDPDGAPGRLMAAALAGFADAFTVRRPDLLVVFGDRYDMLPAALAALPAGLPVAHISGGEVTEGVIDDAIRHATTKLAHLHFPALDVYRRRLIRMGEEPWRIHVVGEPGLDALARLPALPRDQTCTATGLDPARPFCLFTLHPESLRPEASAAMVGQVMVAANIVLRALPALQILFTYPNGDPGAAPIIDAIEAFGAAHPGCPVVPSLGRSRYLALLGHAACMVGNSSSGLVESASFGLPAVDIGDRQKGRVAPATVTNVPAQSAAVAAAWLAALEPARRAALVGVANPYGDGKACARILDVLSSVPLDERLRVKRFYDDS
jgi:UDP-hydrolysing UDP-N-acetyl-D-glucosamine 2-epimerase